MTCFITPHFSDNPYQNLLADHLRRQGVPVRFIKKHHQVRPKALKAGDVLHLHWPPPIQGGLRKALFRFRFLGRLLHLRLKGVRLVWTIHNLVAHEAKHVGADLRFSRRIARLCHQLICHSEGAKQATAEAYLVRPEKISVVPHGNYIGAYPDTVTTAEARAKFGFADDETVLLILGRIRPYKGVDDLLRAFHATQNPKLRLLIAGQPERGVSVESLQAMMLGDPRILLRAEFVADEAIQDYMHACDAAVFPYKRSLTSGAMILAMSYGCACIAYDNDTARSVMDERGCLFVSPHEPHGLDRRLAHLPPAAKLREMGRANRLEAEKNNWARVAKMTAAVYRGAN